MSKLPVKLQFSLDMVAMVLPLGIIFSCGKMTMRRQTFFSAGSVRDLWDRFNEQWQQSHPPSPKRYSSASLCEQCESYRCFGNIAGAEPPHQHQHLCGRCYLQQHPLAHPDTPIINGWGCETVCHKCHQETCCGRALGERSPHDVGLCGSRLRYEAESARNLQKLSS